MNKISSENKQKMPFYSHIWLYLHQFPQVIAKGSQDTPTVSGPAAAALVSASFSCFLLMVNQHLTTIFKQWNDIVWSLGDWIPGSKNPDPLHGEIGSYSGKETIMLIGWLFSWFILSKLWQNRSIKFQTIFFCLFGFLVAATVMNWHPLFPYLPLT